MKTHTVEKKITAKTVGQLLAALSGIPPTTKLSSGCTDEILVRLLRDNGNGRMSVEVGKP